MASNHRVTSLIVLIGLLLPAALWAIPCDTLLLIVPGQVVRGMLALERTDGTDGTEWDTLTAILSSLGESTAVAFTPLPPSGEWHWTARCSTATGRTITQDGRYDFQPPRITAPDGETMRFPPDTITVRIADAFPPHGDRIEWTVEGIPVTRREAMAWDSLSGVARLSLLGAGITLTRFDSLRFCVTATDSWPQPECGIHQTRTCLALAPPQGGCDFHPQPFTPNGDGINDTLYFSAEPLTEGTYRVRDLSTRVLREGNAPQGWDGRDAAGNPLPAGPYLIEVRTGESICRAVGVLVR